MTIYEGSILEGVSHYEKVKALLQGRTDKEAIEMMAHCIATISEYNQYEDEEEDWGKGEECEEEETVRIENAPNPFKTIVANMEDSRRKYPNSSIFDRIFLQQEEETEQRENTPSSVSNDLHKLTNGEL